MCEQVRGAQLDAMHGAELRGYGFNLEGTHPKSLGHPDVSGYCTRDSSLALTGPPTFPPHEYLQSPDGRRFPLCVHVLPSVVLRAGPFLPSLTVRQVMSVQVVRNVFSSMCSRGNLKDIMHCGQEAFKRNRCRTEDSDYGRWRSYAWSL